MSDLVEFLRARLDEDEQVARDAIEAGPSYSGSYGDTAVEETAEMGTNEGCREEASDHIRQWLPDRVLAEVDAKRRIIDKYEHFNDRDDMPQAILTLDWTLRVLAMPYAAHPDFNPAWALADPMNDRLS